MTAPWRVPLPRPVALRWSRSLWSSPQYPDCNALLRSYAQSIPSLAACHHTMPGLSWIRLRDVGGSACGSLEAGVVRLNEPEPLVEAVGVAGVQGPPEVRTWPAVDHDA